MGVSRACLNFFDTPIIDSGTVKATNFKFCAHIYRIDRNKFDFLLVCHSNTGRISRRFGDIAGFLCSWPHPCSALILKVFPLDRSPMFGAARA